MAQIRTPETAKWQIMGAICLLIAAPMLTAAINSGLLIAYIFTAVLLGAMLYCIKRAKDNLGQD